MREQKVWFNPALEPRSLPKEKLTSEIRQITEPGVLDYLDEQQLARIRDFLVASLKQAPVNPTAKYLVDIDPTTGRVLFNSTFGGAFLDIFREANAYCAGHRRQPAITKETIEWFSRRTEAVIREPYEKGAILLDTRIQIAVPDSINLPRWKQERLLKSRDCSLASPEEVAAAAVLYFCKTGRPPIPANCYVRTALRGCTFQFHPWGLNMHEELTFGGYPRAMCAGVINHSGMQSDNSPFRPRIRVPSM